MTTNSSGMFLPIPPPTRNVWSVLLLLASVTAQASSFSIGGCHHHPMAAAHDGKSKNNNAMAFTNRLDSTNHYANTPTRLFSTEIDADADHATEQQPDPSSMRIKEIKHELNEMGISSADCFDKESLCARLLDARSGAIKGHPTKRSSSDADGADTEASPTPTKSSSSFDRESAAQELRSKRVKELRTMCAQKDIRWAHMIEKEELVTALVDYQEKAADFSPSGVLSPGSVAMVDDTVLEKELVPGAATTPLMLDVFATWCGPCKLMAPQLDEAASELGDRVRVAKIDSDQYPEFSGRLKVSGLPTIIVFDGKTGQELERVEGALMKDQLVQFAKKYT